jgi:O-methyltransferase involved in polyketide biosynthesis
MTTKHARILRHTPQHRSLISEDTTFYRIDNGSIESYDLDLLNVIGVRRQLLPEPARTTYLAKSLLDASWCRDVEHTEDGVFIICGGVLDWLKTRR